MLPVSQDKGRFRKFGKKYKDGYHVGHDFDCPENTIVSAVDDGDVIFSDEVSGFGSMYPRTPGGVIIIRHSGYIALYGHLCRQKQKGDKVKQGEQIGTVAMFTSGDDELPHLHFAKAKGKNVPLTKWGYVQTEKELNMWANPLEEI